MAGFSVVTDEDTENVIGMMTDTRSTELVPNSDTDNSSGYYYYDPSGNKVLIPAKGGDDGTITNRVTRFSGLFGSTQTGDDRFDLGFCTQASFVQPYMYTGEEPVVT